MYVCIYFKSKESEEEKVKTTKISNIPYRNFKIHLDTCLS